MVDTEASNKGVVRPYYSGFIVFGAEILSIATGMAFTLLLTRNMTQDQFGIWGNVFDVVSYFLLLSGVFPFWATRFVARGTVGAGKTGIIANLVTSLLLVSAYLVITPIVTSALGISGQYTIIYLIAAFQIVNAYLITGFESILRAKRPQTIGYGLIVEEITKVVLAYVLIVRLNQLLLGALVSLIAGTAMQIVYYLGLTLPEIRHSINWTCAKEWLKSSIFNVYNAIGNQLSAFNVILLFVYGGQAARGNYQAAGTYANMIGYSLYLSYALYTVLLTKSSSKLVTSSLKIVLTFAVPMMTVTVSLAPSLLTILNVHFADVSSVLILLSIDSLVVVIYQFYSNVVLGTEKLDEHARIPIRKLMKSRIFKVFSLPYLQAAISIPLALYLLTTLARGQDVTAAAVLAASTLTAHVACLAVEFAVMHKSVAIGIPWLNIAKYGLAGAVSAAFYYFFIHPTTLSATVGVGLTGLLIYALVLLAIDKDTRDLAQSLLKEILPRSGSRV